MKLFSTDRNNTMQSERMELGSLKVLFSIYAFFIIASIVMPQYFGVNVGVDITCARLSNLLFIAYILFNPKICTHFLQTTLRCEILIPILCYLLVAAYTMVLRVNINAFFLVFFEMFSLFMMIYGIRYVVGYKRAIKWIIGCAYFLGFYGLFEFVYGRSLFLQIFRTLPTTVANAYRSGQYRIMGPCGHALGYGLLLLLFVAVACIDLEKNEIYLFKRPVLLATLFLNVFLTGSRSTLGLIVLEFVIILVFSTRRNVKKSLFFGLTLVVCLTLFLLVFGRTEIGNYILGQIASVIDQLLDTNYAANFGVEVERLEDSEKYREALPLILKLDWLNPLVGRGTTDGFGAEINGVFIHSIDNYFVAQYIKFAYPGMVSYVLFILIVLVVLIRDLANRGSAVTKMVFIGVVIYFINLWWVDALQTLKFVYIFIALFYANYLESKDKKCPVNKRGLR